MTDFIHYARHDVWFHPGTCLVILGEDMPDELEPAPKPRSFSDGVNYYLDKWGYEPTYSFAAMDAVSRMTYRPVRGTNKTVEKAWDAAERAYAAAADAADVAIWTTAKSHRFSARQKSFRDRLFRRYPVGEFEGRIIE